MSRGRTSPDGVVAHHKIPQVGNVVIEDDVEIGANCAIDRATLGGTVIGRGTKFSNLISIGHGARIGPHGLLVGLVGIAGSTKLGQYVTLGGQVGIADHLGADAGKDAGRQAVHQAGHASDRLVIGRDAHAAGVVGECRRFGLELGSAGGSAGVALDLGEKVPA